MKQPHHICIPVPIRLWMRLFFLLVFVALTTSETFAQHYNFRNFSTNEGLPSNFVYRVYEDQSGFFWYLTEKGISRFDGVNWRYFSSEDGYAEVGAFHVAQSSDGVIWFITTNFKLYTYQNNRFHKMPLENVAWIDIDEKGNKWIVTRENKIFQYNTDGFIRVKFNNTRIKGIVYSILRTINLDFIISTSSAVYRVDSIGKKVDVLVEANTFENFIPPRIFKRKNGDIIISNDKGVYLYNLKQKDIRLLLRLAGNEVFTFLEDAFNSEILLGTFRGLIKLRLGYDAQVLSREVFLSSSIVSSMIEVDKRYILISTLNGGVYFCNFNAIHYTSKDGIEQENISFIKGENGRVYFFTSGGIVYMRVDKGLVKYISNGIPFGATGRIENVVNAHDTLLLISTNNTYKLQRGKISEWKLDKLNRGFFWLHNRDENINRILERTLAGKKSITQTDINNYINVNKLEIVISRTIANIGNQSFFQSKSGVISIHHNEEKITGHEIFDDLEFVTDIKSFGNNMLIVATENKGIVVINGYKKRKISLEDGLISNYCKRIFIRNDVIWICTNKGLTKLILDKKNLKVKTIKNFSKSNLLIDNEVNDLYFLEDSIFVATDKGVSVFHKDYVGSVKSPDVVIEKVQINNVDTVLQAQYILPHNYNNINVEYSCPNRMELLFKYSLNDTLSNFNYTKSNELRLGSLMPGYYNLFIWAQNSEGTWSQKPAVVTFIILKPFWQRIWFIISVCVVFIVIAYAVVVYRLNQIKKRNAIEAQLLESELRALRLHMNPHFIFNTLNSLQKFTLEHNPIEANKFIAQFSRLMRWIMSYSDKQYISLEEELNFLDTYVLLEQLRFDKVFSFTKEIDERIQPTSIFIPALVIQPFVENAIKYGISGLNRQGQLFISFKWDESFLNVTVEDNGVGREKIRQEQLLSGKQFESTGIKYTNERLLLLLENKLKVENAVTVTDLYALDGSASGTRVELIIPYYYE